MNQGHIMEELMKQKKVLIHTFSFFIAPVILLAGCVSPMGMTASTSPIEGRKTEIIGKTGGCSNWAGAVFGLWTVKRADINRGIENALLMENDVMIVRRADRRELAMKKGAVLAAEKASVVVMDEVESAAAALPAGKNTPMHELDRGSGIFVKEGKMYLAGSGRETEILSGDVIRSGDGLELKLIRAQESGRMILKKISGDMLVYIDGSPRRPGDNEALDAGEGFGLSRITGDVLLNVRWYERTYYFILFSLHRVYVEGDAARFVKDEAPPASDDARKPEPKKAGGGRGR